MYYLWQSEQAAGEFQETSAYAHRRKTLHVPSLWVRLWRQIQSQEAPEKKAPAAGIFIDQKKVCPSEHDAVLVSIETCAFLHHYDYPSLNVECTPVFNHIKTPSYMIYIHPYQVEYTHYWSPYLQCYILGTLLRIG